MTKQPVFIDLVGTDDISKLAPPPVSGEVRLPGRNATPAERSEERFGHLLPHGTTVSEHWDDSWVAKVVDVEKESGHPICGAKRSSSDFTKDDNIESPELLVCRRRAGWGTDHVGEGRCSTHTGNMPVKTARFSMLKNRKISSRVEEFFENEQLTDMRTVISTMYAAADTILDEDEEVSSDQAKMIVDIMSKIGVSIKQHNDIQEKRKISIEVPEFMAWADFFYDLAIRHIQEAEGDVAAFLRDAQGFYDRTVTIVVGADARRDRLGASDEISGIEDAGIPRPVIEVT